MGGQLSQLSETDQVSVDPAVLTLNRDREVPVRTDRTAIFGNPPPETDAEWHTMVFPEDYARGEGSPVYYRVPGVAFGVCAGRKGSRVVLRVTWPKRNFYVSVSEEHLELVRRQDIVDGIKVPPDYTRAGITPQHSHLPVKTRVRFLSAPGEDKGRQVALGECSGGLQRNINLCYFKRQ